MNKSASKLNAAVDRLKAAFDLLGLDCSGPDMRDTPLRVARWIQELAKNQGKMPRITTDANYDPLKEIKLTAFEGKGLDELIVYGPIEFQSACAHHLLPFSGTVYVGYLPNGKIIGASKIPRLVNFFAQQPTTQEYLTQQIASYVDDLTEARFTGVMMSAVHCCVSCRGVRKQGMLMKTSCFIPSTNPNLKAEFIHQAG